MNETDSEDEIETSVPVTTRPPCNSDATAYKKKARLAQWVADPSLAEKNLQRTADAMNTLKNEYVFLPVFFLDGSLFPMRIY